MHYQRDKSVHLITFIQAREDSGNAENGGLLMDFGSFLNIHKMNTEKVWYLRIFTGHLTDFQFLVIQVSYQEKVHHSNIQELDLILTPSNLGKMEDLTGIHHLITESTGDT
jgi:hypothetical protein